MHHDDIIVMGSDGLFDNLWECELDSTLRNQVQEDGLIRDLDDAARVMAREAMSNSNREKIPTPFQYQRCIAENNDKFTGGK